MKINFICILLLSITISFSQNDKKISIHYKTKSYIDIEALDAKTKANTFKMEYAIQLKKNYESIEYILNIVGNTSKFETIMKMNISNMHKNRLQSRENTHSFYVDTEQYIEQVDFLGEKLLIIEPSKQFEWILTTETKNILGYRCYKANYFKEGVTNNLKIEAWYAPELPYQFGPKGYHGLPGLILEIIRNEKLAFIADKINWDAKVFAIKPTKGRKISQSDFDIMLGNAANEIKSYNKN